jgi:murein DD-endopeptidase MepM/ murein hydrolase activator NlpD
VQSGDTIDSIAVAYGLTRQEIMDLNNISDPRIIQIGQELTIHEASSGGSRGSSNDDNADATDEASDSGSSDAGGEDTTSDNPPDTASDENNGDDNASDEQPSDENTSDEQPADEGDSDEDAVPTSTPAPPAPVVSIASGNVLPARDPAANTASVCMIMFDDANQNRLQEDGEALLAEGKIALTVSGSDAGEYTTDGASEPYCIGDLAPGEYVALGTAPDGYGLTTPGELRVRAAAGARIDLVYGAAQGVQPALMPPPDDALSPEIVEQPAAPAAVSNPLIDNIGLVVFGLAGVVLVVGTGATLLLRRR